MSEEFPDTVKERKPKQILLHASIYQVDKDMLEQIAQWLGTNRSDAVRTAIRHYYASLTGEPAQD